VSALAARVCAHCGLPLDASEVGDFCCEGCLAVHDLLVARNLGRYYDLRGARGVPVNDVRPERRDAKWLDLIDANRKSARINLDLQGLHCSACVWLIEKLFAQYGGLRIVINSAAGRAHLLVPPGFDLRGFVSEVERFGYRFGPPLPRPVRRSSTLLWRLGVCVAIAMNTMIFAIAIYAGLQPGPLHDMFEALNLGLSAIAVAVGGSVFFVSAYRGVRRGILHLDLPIAIGIGLAFAGSVGAFLARRSSGIFVDTLDVFIALMLLGRYLQERVLERNRLSLLENDGAEGLLVRRERDHQVETVRCTQLEPGDRIVVAAGDLVPVDASVVAPEASFSLDWLNGESAPRVFHRREVVPAGAFSASPSPTRLVVLRDLASSGLVDLLRTPVARSTADPWWQRLSKVYAGAVLVLATGAFIGWMVATHDFARALEVTTAVLVVTCPCAFGIATPLANELALAGLRRAGLFVRTATFLDRAAEITTVVFDKTGTLTSGALTVTDTTPIAALSIEARSALHDLAAATWHPKAAAVLRAVKDIIPTTFGVIAEEPGRGMSLRRSGSEWRLGSAEWVAKTAPVTPDADLAFGVDGRLLATIGTTEELRTDARHEVDALRAGGYDVWLLSGDTSDRTRVAAQTAGIAPTHAIGSCSAAEKASWVAAHDHGDLLMVGDGINDSLVVEQATCGGTPAIDRPFMAARSDFYFVTPGLHPVRLALVVAKKVARVRNRNLVIALAYNVLSIGLAYAGLMSPLLCAVLMPASSLATVLGTVSSLSPRSALWKS
jgi:P-type Cu2+ transporter